MRINVDFLNQRNVLIFLFCVVSVEMLLAVLGAVTHFSPVPMWDMWDAVHFYETVRDEGRISWWGQHNEHLIVLTRLLIWLDFTLFNGSLVFLITCNYLLASVSCVVFYHMLCQTLPDKRDLFARTIIAGVMICMLFYWAQRENFIWEFQSQFFMSQLFPLLGFYLLYLSHQQNSVWTFLLACLAGVLSLGTMANGVFAFPLMIGLSIALKMKRLYTAILIIFAIVTLSIYFYDFHLPLADASLTQIVFQYSVSSLKYFFVYLGSPFYALTSSLHVSACAGLFLTLNVIYFLNRARMLKLTSSLPLVLLTYLLYVVVTAISTAVGRYDQGLYQAISSRYYTPALMAWASLLLLYAPYFAAQARIHYQRILPLLLIPLLLLPYQMKALSPNQNKLFERMVAALALTLRIQDDGQIKYIYPLPDSALLNTQRAVEEKHTVFSHPIIRDAAELMGKRDEEMSSGICTGEVYNTIHLDSAPKYMRVEGFLFNAEANHAPKVIHLLSIDRTIIGYAITGKKDSHGKKAGFKGYMFSKYEGIPIILKGISPGCEVSDGQ